MDSWIIQIAVAVCGIIIVGGFTAYFLMTRMMRSIPEMEAGRKRVGELTKRVDQLERRITDIQDVVITLDDRLKKEGISVASQPTTRTDEG